MSDSFPTEVLGQLRELGSDISRPHQFDFYLYLPTQEVARAAAERVRVSGYSAKVKPGVSNKAWLCRASTTLVPAEAQLDDIGRFFEEVAITLRGDFDGWESDVVPSSDLDAKEA